jgi:flagellar motor switch protein FliM
MDESWSKMIDACSSLDKLETSMQFAQIVDMNEPVLMVTLNITIGTESGIIGFCLPHQALEPFTKKLNTKIMFSGNANKIVSNPTHLISSIIKTDIVVSSEFNPTLATVNDIVDLSVGDVIQLQHRVDEPVIVKYQNLPRFRAALGKHKSNIALKITDVIKGDEDNE